MNIKTVLNYIPQALISEMDLNKLNTLQEIRFRVNRNAILKYDNEEVITSFIPTERDLINILQKLCENSIYSYQSQICNGFITINGGHRIGITGNITMQNGKIANINYISSLNFRIAKEIIGISDEVINEITYRDFISEKINIYNTLIISKPGCRKNNFIKRLS